MLYLIDECFPKRFVLALRSAGHDVTWAREACAGEDDDIVLARATREGRILITEDRGLSELVFRQGLPAPGIITVRTSRSAGDLSTVADVLARIIDELGRSLEGAMTIVEPGRVRQRPLAVLP